MIRNYFILTAIILGVGCVQHKEMTLADVESKEDLIEYGKTKQAQDDWEKGQNLVRDFKATLPGKTPEELIGLFVTHPKLGYRTASPPEYYLYRDGNEAIKEELKRRGKTIESTLIKYRKDDRYLFTGDNGDIETIGWICQILLEEINGNPNKGMDFTGKTPVD